MLVEKISFLNMPKVTYIESNGDEHVVLALDGANAMETALENGVPGIDGFCGGQASCATCHVYVDEPWLGAIGKADPAIELALLEPLGATRENSRLACQIKLTRELHGLVLRMPEKQG
ncbi:MULTISPECIES: 2Fe-2S iron-sulfur cluster-binding protein [Burkholderia cepacia complex]|uniref:2Fe-2S iron-sulfur cluster-binding protein n=1 Tax=Burkholderia cepacia complex TaxID=87882 RepID=UPI001F16AB22|nr:2Fe-2S iron-sulfur cluster-binding protein [Burkholderia cenocepacia]